VDALSGHCNRGVAVARAVGDYILSTNGLLAAFMSFATPTVFAPTTSPDQLCEVLTQGDVGGTYLYDLTCNQWLKANRLTVPLPSPLMCTMTSSAFNNALTKDLCKTVITSVAALNMTNAFFLPYNTSVSLGANPTVYAAAGPTTEVTPTNVGGTVPPTSGDAPALSPAALATLQSFPPLGALSFYSQATNLRSLCTNFNVVLELIAQLSTSGSGNNGGGGTTSPTVLESATSNSNFTTGSYQASGLLFGFVAGGSFGLLLFLQLTLFLMLVAWRACFGRVKQGVHKIAEVAMTSTPNNRQRLDE
jgi:hypothetical protein